MQMVVLRQAAMRERLFDKHLGAALCLTAQSIKPWINTLISHPYPSTPHPASPFTPIT